MRKVKIYEPHDRRYVENNLYCHSCGNVNQFSVDLKLKYNVESSPNGLLFNLESTRTKRILQAIEDNIYQMLERSYNREKPIFRCANCHNATFDFHEHVLESCYYLDCPGCWHCGNYIDMETEYHNNPDEFSKSIILSHLDSMLKYAQRFYKRQFIDRKPLSG